MKQQLLFAIAMTAPALIATSLHAEEQIIEIESVASGRLYADYTFGDCCTLDAFNANPSTITVGNCATLGGYCTAGKRIASWMFPLPSFPENATLISSTVDGRHNGGGTSFEFRAKWFSNSEHGYSTALNGWNAPNFTGSAGATGGDFSVPLQIELIDGQWSNASLLVSAYQSGGLTFYNSGTLRPKIRLAINIPDDSCDGDMNDDEIVDITDLLAAIEGWGTLYNITDLLAVIEHWGVCP